MKLLVSDYDGTLNPDKDNLWKLDLNLHTVDEFREENHFMIATGRTFKSIKEEIKKYNIGYDYLSCNDGAVLFDKNDNILFYHKIEREILLPMTAELHELKNVKNIYLYGPYDEELYYDNICELFVRSKTLGNSNIKRIVSKYPVVLDHFGYFNYIKSFTSKALSVEFVSYQNDYSDIITVGDGRNDLDMLLEYDGYKLISSDPELYFKGLKNTLSVKTLIKKL